MMQKRNQRRVRMVLKLNILCALILLTACGQNAQHPGADADQRLNLAHTFYNNQLFEAAIHEYEAYLAAFPVDVNKRANIIYQIANIYFERLNDYDKALENYLRIKYLYPQSNLQGEVGKKIVDCLERLERSQDAQRLLEKETALKPQEVEESRPGEVIAKIGKREITQGDIDFEINQLPPYLQSQFDTKEKKLAFVRQYVAEALLYDSAKRQNLDQDKEIIAGTFRAKKQLMAQKVLQDELKKMIDIKQADVELYYKANRDKYTEKDEKGKVTRQKSFQECAQEVAQDMFMEKQQDAYKQLIDRLMKAENVTLYEKRLK